MSAEVLQVIGQVDKKFICALCGNGLIMFDQHAVHERIIVEQYVKDYKGVKSPIPNKVPVLLPHEDFVLLKTNQTYLESLGLGVEFFTSNYCFNVTGMPLCLMEKFSLKNNEKNIKKILNVLLKDILRILNTTSRYFQKFHLPEIMQSIMNHEACTSAINVGVELSREECQNLLTELNKCHFPVQCAHGRPTLALILDMRKIPPIKKKVSKINLRKLWKNNIPPITTKKISKVNVPKVQDRIGSPIIKKVSKINLRKLLDH